MATESYRIAQTVIGNMKSRCPRLIVPDSECSGRLAIFAGTAAARTLDVERVITSGDTYWTHLDRDLALRKWHDPVNEQWLAHSCREILLDEIYQVSGIPNRGDPQGAPGMDDDTVGLIEKALRIAKRKLWGIPVNLLSEKPFFHFMLTGYAKKSVSETVWKLACRNAGNIYSVNDVVMADAQQEKSVYENLYAIHPLLGRAWVPWIRVFVEHSLQEDARSSEYAKQFKQAMRKQGISAAGVRTIHRFAELSPAIFRRSMHYLVKHTGDDCAELLGMLHFLNGHKPPSGASFGQLVEHVLDPFGPPGRLPADLDLMIKINRWMEADPRFDRDLVYDWMRSMVDKNHGALSRGYCGAIKGIQSARKRKEAVLIWANRAQAQWHRTLPRVGWICTEDESLINYSWESLLSARGIQRDSHGVFSYALPSGQWVFVELDSSHALMDEGKAMSHCVDYGYDMECRAGRSRIFSVRNRTGERISTLELRPGRGKVVRVNGRKCPQFSHYRIAQNRGYENREVSKDCILAACRFLDFINNKD